MSQTQDARAVAYRALCLGALLQRAEFELALQNTHEIILFEDIRQQVVQKHHDFNKRLLDWLDNEKLAARLSDNERYLLQKPLGSWSEKALISVGWRFEALGVMLWALQRLESIPAYDEQFDPEIILEPLDICNPTIDFIWLANLRPDDELRQALDQAELWNWRSRVTELERMGVRPPQGVSFREIIRVTAEGAYLNQHIPQPIQGDFPVYGKAYIDLSYDEYTLTSAIAYERYFSLNWVCELTSEWEKVRVDR